MTALEIALHDSAQLTAKLKGDERSEARAFLSLGSSCGTAVRLPISWFSHDALPPIFPVAEAAVSVRALRRGMLATNGWSLRDLYRNVKTPGTNRLRDAPAALDSAVRAAYGMKDTEDTLAFLLALKMELADKEARRVQVTPPGLAVPAGEAAEFMSEDSVTVREGERG